MEAHPGLTKQRELLVLIELLEGILAQAETIDAESFRAHVWLSLSRVIREIERHFETERMSLAEDFDDDPELANALRELDRQQPAVLEKFSRASASVAVGGNFLSKTVVSLLREAIVHFHEHEEREAALFVRGSLNEGGDPPER